jgi:hypothetical protein
MFNLNNIVKKIDNRIFYISVIIVQFISTLLLAIYYQERQTKVVVKELRVAVPYKVSEKVPIIVKVFPKRRGPVKNPQLVKNFKISTEFFNEIEDYLYSQSEVVSIQSFIEKSMRESQEFIKWKELVDTNKEKNIE